MEADFKDILRANKDTIYRICDVYAGGNYTRDDLFQEVLLEGWNAMPSFRRESSVNTWVYRICLNVCMRYQYRDKKKLKHTVPLNEQQILIAAEEENAQTKERVEELYSCIRKLKASDRAIMVLYLEDLSYREIGAIAGLSENHVAVKVKRIKSRLFNCLNERHDG